MRSATTPPPLNARALVMFRRMGANSETTKEERLKGLGRDSIRRRVALALGVGRDFDQAAVGVAAID
jgi:hypothetical protein